MSQIFLNYHGNYSSPPMKKLIQYIAIIILILSGFQAAEAQYTLDNTGGSLKNSGTIRVKRGETKAMPDTIGGRMEFLQPASFSQQAIPNIVYYQLVLKNEAKKIILDSKDGFGNVKSLVVRDSLIISDDANFTTDWIGLNAENVIAQSTVKNTALFSGQKDIIMQNDVAAQNLSGTGNFSRLNIDNPFGVNVTSGGFGIDQKLTLTRGELRNTEINNFSLRDSALIERHVGASLAAEPIFEGGVDVRYVGAGSLASSAELPKTEKVVRNLMQENSGDLVLSNNVHVSDSLYIAGRILTKNDTLTYASQKNIVYKSDNLNAEIDGTLALTNLRTDSTRMILHNPLTYALFRDELASNGISKLIVTIRPRTFPTEFMGNSKVRRQINIDARDQADNRIESGMKMSFGYAWRNLPFDSLDENNNLPINQVILQRWGGSNWNDNNSSRTSRDSSEIGWAYGFASDINDFGIFALGASGGLLTLNAKVFLEGPYRNGAMTNDLQQRNLISMPPPDIYPYNLDPSRKLYITQQLPDSVVDWVVVEFRENFTSQGKIRTYLLKRDGKIVDLYNNELLVLTGTGDDTNRIDSGEYYVAIRHRNHLAVVSRNYVQFMPGSTSQADFTNPDFVMGGLTSLKPVERLADNSFLYGMVAGEMTGSIFESGRIDENDFNNVIPILSNWSLLKFDGYLTGDMNLDGIITTKDFNVSFNNRTKVSALP